MRRRDIFSVDIFSSQPSRFLRYVRQFRFYSDIVLSFLRFKRAFLACAGSCSDRNPPDF